MIHNQATEGPSSRTTRVLLLRHAETSAPDRFHGMESDVGLGPNGLRQALAVADRIAGFRPVALYSSGLQRARQTAEPIALACGLPLGIVPELHERRMGPLSGTPQSETRPVYETAKRQWSTGDLDHSHEGGESFAQIRDRVCPAFLALADRHQGESIVVVAHGIVIRVLITTIVEGYSHRDFAKVGIEHVAIHELLRNDGTWRLKDTHEAPSLTVG